jgi:hypothetical protein
MALGVGILTGDHDFLGCGCPTWTWTRSRRNCAAADSNEGPAGSMELVSDPVVLQLFRQLGHLLASVSGRGFSSSTLRCQAAKASSPIALRSAATAAGSSAKAQARHLNRRWRVQPLRQEATRDPDRLHDR